MQNHKKFKNIFNFFSDARHCDPDHVCFWRKISSLKVPGRKTEQKQKLSRWRTFLYPKRRYVIMRRADTLIENDSWVKHPAGQNNKLERMWVSGFPISDEAGPKGIRPGGIFSFTVMYWKWRFSYFEASLKCHRCKKSFSDELKSIKTKNRSGAVSYENIRIFNNSAVLQLLIWAAELCSLPEVKLMFRNC